MSHPKRFACFVLLANVLIARHVLAMGIAVPAYFAPPSTTWTQLVDGAPTVGIAVINPNDGPGSSYSAAYFTAVQSAQSRGIRVLGYVYTSYGARSQATLKSQIDQYYTWYKVDGIFFDEGSTDCTLVPWHQTLVDYVKAKGGYGLTVLNPGTSTSECYASVFDILCIFEDDYSKYAAFTPPAWTANYPASKFWHLLINCPEASVVAGVTASASKHAGWVYATPDNLPNPWDTLPGATYWQSQLSTVAALTGTTTTTTTTTTPPGPAPGLSAWVAWNDATTCTFKYTFANGPWAHHRVYVDSSWMLEDGALYRWSGAWTWVQAVPFTLSATTAQWSVPRAAIGKGSYPASLSAVFQAAQLSGTNATSLAYTQTFSAATGSVVSYYGCNDAANLYYRAKFTTSWTYKHVYIDLDRSASTGFAVGGAGAEYLIENGVLYRYVGPGWKWQSVSGVTRSTSNQTTSWTVPRSSIGATAGPPTTHRLVFEGSAGSTSYTAPSVLHPLSY